MASAGDLQQVTAIVTGAGTGIGAAVARALVGAGARVGLVGRTRATLDQAAAGLPADRALVAVCDITDRETVAAMATEVGQRLGPVNLLVNNAGTNTSPRSLLQLDPAEFDRVVAVNLTGTFNCMHAVLPAMYAARSGTVINVSSIAGLRASALAGGAYAASKHGAVALAHQINQELREYGIRSTVICPGEVATPILDQRPEPPPPERRAQMLQPEDVAEAVLMVARLPPRANVP